MSIKERYFLVGNEWNVLHLPNKPNGFAVFIVGDINHFVHANTSSWNQSPDHFHFIQQLKNEGYTVVLSNLLGRHWGSDESCEILLRVINEVIKKEILNKKVHIIAEGMGALVAAKLIPNKQEIFRSVIMIDPCLNLKDFFNEEKHNKLFYKRFLKELKQAYKLEGCELEKAISEMSYKGYKAMSVPTKIFYRINKTPFSLEHHIRPYEQMCQAADSPFEVSIFLESKRIEQFAKPAIQFIKQFEELL